MPYLADHNWDEWVPPPSDDSQNDDIFRANLLSNGGLNISKALDCPTVLGVDELALNSDPITAVRKDSKVSRGQQSEIIDICGICGRDSGVSICHNLLEGRLLNTSVHAS
jgi:hypothetical protein